MTSTDLLHNKLGSYDNFGPKGGTCPYCGEPGTANTREHILPQIIAQTKEQGKKLPWDIWVCETCNQEKGHLDKSITSWNEWNIDDKAVDRRIFKTGEFRELFGGMIHFMDHQSNGGIRIAMDPFYLKLWEPWAINVVQGSYYLQEWPHILKEGNVEFTIVEDMDALVVVKHKVEDRSKYKYMYAAIKNLEEGKGEQRGPAKFYCRTIETGFVIDWGDWYFFLRLASTKSKRGGVRVSQTHIINHRDGLLDSQKAYENNKVFYDRGYGCIASGPNSEKLLRDHFSRTPDVAYLMPPHSFPSE